MTTETARHKESKDYKILILLTETKANQVEGHKKN